MERVVSISSKKQLSDYHYWKQKSVSDRLNAIEFLRKQYNNYEHQLSKGLQRVCRIIRKA